VLALMGWTLFALNYCGKQRPVVVGPDAVARAADAAAARRAPDVRRRPPDQAAVKKSPKTLTLRSFPGGARVLLDQRPAGVTPLTLELPSQPFELELNKKGYRSFRRQIDPATQVTQELRVVLRTHAARRDVGYVTINTLPWSRVYVDGQYLGNTPLVKQSIAAGKHTVELRDTRGALRKRFSITLRPGQTFRYRQ